MSNSPLPFEDFKKDKNNFPKLFLNEDRLGFLGATLIQENRYQYIKDHLSKEREAIRKQLELLSLGESNDAVEKAMHEVYKNLRQAGFSDQELFM